MDLLTSGSKQEGKREDPAIMLFGKQIKSMSTKNAEKIKEEFSPRGVDEKGVSFATTSSDEDEDLSPSVEVAYEDAMHVEQSASFLMGSVFATSEQAREHATKRKSSETECVARDEDAQKPKSTATECVTVRMEGDNHAGRQKGGIWSRCPRCNSADTKFCYFNNYNVNQPRHFCKHCQRYWTAGGTLRNVPIGAGKRKNKHALHKHNLIVNSTRTLAVPTRILPVGVPNPDPLSIVKSDPLPTVKSDPFSLVKSNCVNTNLELSPHHSFTDSPSPSLTPCIQSQATTPMNIIHPHSPHKLMTLHQLHDNLQTRFSQINHPNLASGYSKLGQIYPDLAYGCSQFSQLCPDSASGSSGLRKRSPILQNGSYGVNQICPHLHDGGLSGCQICPDLQSGYSEFARSGPHLGSGSSRLPYACPHVQKGCCETSLESLDCRRNELSGLSKSERGLSDTVELKGNLESKQSASLERGLPDLAKTALEEGKLQSKASFLQIGYPEMDPNEAQYKCMQRCNEMKPIGCLGSNECKVHMRGECNGLVETKAPPMCLQGDYAQAIGLLGKSEEAFNIENIMKRGVGEGHNGLLPIGGGLWPYFYNMFWLDPLAFSHFRPILTPQGWALPFMPPHATTMEPTSHTPHNSRTPPTCMLDNFDSSSTLTTSSTPTTLFEDVTADAPRDITTPSLEQSSTEHEDHDGFDKFKTI